MKVLSKLEEIEIEYRKLEEELGKPENISSSRYAEILQRYAKLKKIMEQYAALKELETEVTEAEEMLQGESDEEMRRLIAEELAANNKKRELLLEQMKLLLLPEDPQDAKDAIVEIRAGAGGEESALFAADLFRMYKKYAENKGFSTDVMDAHPTSIGGFKSIIFAVVGKGAYGHFKFESGVHRVQRVPKTEASGRIHTSTATVAVLPEVEAVEISLKEEDLKIETFRAGGPGGQHVNKTDSAVRIIHIPSGLVVACQEERSQHKNKEKALRILRARLKEKLESEAAQQRAQARRIQIGSAARSEKIRTYNFPQNRVTDHRIELTLYKLEDILEGNLDPLVEALSKAYKEEMI